MKNRKEKKTVVIGASPKPHRFSYSAVTDLKHGGHPVEAIGLRKEWIGEIEIKTDQPDIENAHTVTLYVGPQNQPVYYDYIINVLKPERIIFNPGTENFELEELARKNGIQVVVDCTLQMLAMNTF
jgi:predicted CoA-binding protein